MTEKAKTSSQSIFKRVGRWQFCTAYNEAYLLLEAAWGSKVLAKTAKNLGSIVSALEARAPRRALPVSHLEWQKAARMGEKRPGGEEGGGGVEKCCNALQLWNCVWEQ